MHKHHIGLFIAIGIVFFGVLYDIHFTEQQLLAAVPVPVTFPYKNIALTFDDGPYGNATQQVIDILKKNNIKATFFIVGKNAEHYPSQVKQEVADGHVIGNHSYDHSHTLSRMPVAQLKNNIDHTEQILMTLTGLQPRLFRAPYGDTSPGMIKELQREGYVIVDWNVDPNDWNQNNTSEVIVQYVVSHARKNSIVLLHDGRDTRPNYSRDNMLNALPQIITKLQQHGYTFVTVDKILNQKPYH
jgi:peptidoglycan/xylan/chitin deacetylase (PgdA/CDA1 family)